MSYTTQPVGSGLKRSYDDVYDDTDQYDYDGGAADYFDGRPPKYHRGGDSKDGSLINSDMASIHEASGFAPPAPKRCRRLGPTRRGPNAKLISLVSTGSVRSETDLMRKFVSSLISKETVVSHSEQLVAGTGESLTRKINCAVVKEYGFRLPTVNTYFALNPLSRVTITNTEANNETIKLYITRKFSYLNTTNVTLYCHSTLCTAKQDVPDDMQPRQCWQYDLTTPGSLIGYSNDLNTEARSVYNYGVWNLGGRGSRFSQYWSASPWEQRIILPGKLMEFTLVEHVVMTKLDYDRRVGADGTVFSKGQKVLMMKVTGERAISSQTGLTQDIAEGTTGTKASGHTYSAFVEFLENCDQTIRYISYPGFADSIHAPVSQAIVTAGVQQYGAMIVTDSTTNTNAMGSIYDEHTGLWKTPGFQGDIGFAVEAVAEQQQGVDESSALRQPME